MTQLEKINEEKVLLKIAITESIDRISEIIEGGIVTIGINNRVQEFANGTKKLIGVDVEVSITI